MVPREGLVSSSVERMRGSPTGSPSPHSSTELKLVSSLLMVPREGLASSSVERMRGSPTGWPSPHSSTDSRCVSSLLWSQGRGRSHPPWRGQEDHQHARRHLTPLQIQGVSHLCCGTKGEVGLILRGEDERITNTLAITSLLYRFKVSLISPLWSQGKDWSHHP
jgi:hypothetical protein